MKPRCSECNTAWAYPEGIPAEPNDGRRVDPPRCTVCAAPIRPGVVWFGEGLPDEDWQLAAMAAHECDLLLSVGTSALVYPAAELPQRAARKGAKVVQVNPQKTALDAIADWNLHGAAGELLPRLVTSAFPAQ